jgi:prepilin-type N-terminal cleavage/methylation domain-containing protein
MFFKQNKIKINKKRVFQEKRGFTLIEIIMGMGIVIFLSAAMFRVVSVSNTNQGLIVNAEKIKAGIRTAQSYSLSIPQESGEKRHICGYGINRQTDSSFVLYYLYALESSFSGDVDLCDYNDRLRYTNGSGIGKVDLQVINLNEGYTINQYQDVFFKSPYGEILENGVPLSSSSIVSFGIVDRSGQSINVNLNSVGRVYLD